MKPSPTNKRTYRSGQLAILPTYEKQERAALTFREFVDRVNPRYVWYKHCVILAEALQRVADGQCTRLMVFMPPRHGKSELVSRLFAAYYLYRNPERWIGMNCYGADLAYGMSRNARENYQRAGAVLSNDAWAARHWETGYGGGMWATGVGGPITGKGFHCFPPDSLIETSHGKMNIETLCQLWDKPEVLSFNHDTRKLEWRKIVATARQPGKPILEITLHSGGRMRCTTDHPVYSLERGYIQAGDLVQGETVIKIPNLQEMSALRKGNGTGGTVQPMLSTGTRHQNKNKMRLLRYGIPAHALSSRKITGFRQCRSLLFAGMQSTSPQHKESSEMFALREEYRNQNEPFLQRLSPQRTAGFARHLLRVLQNNVSTKIPSYHLLRKRMRGYGPFHKNAGNRQQSLQGWQQLRGVVQAHEAYHPGTRWSSLRNLWIDQQTIYNKANVEERQFSASIRFDDPSYRQQPAQQSSREFNNTLRQLSQKAPCSSGQWQKDTVSTVTLLGERPQFVYDLQVEGNRNFFADGVLVHNCGIIDDPLKNSEDAQSPKIRQTQKDWIGTTFGTREEPGGAIILVQTRWHNDDAAGYWLSMEEEEPEHWHIVRLEAIKEDVDYDAIPATCTLEPDFRKPGEALCPERYNIAKLRKMERRIGDYYFGALYQQRPQPASGAIFKREWWDREQNRYDGSDRAHRNRVVARWIVYDTALKDGAGNDYSAAAVWELWPDYRVAIRHMWNERIQSAMLPERMEADAVEWNKDGKLRGLVIEDKGSGTNAIQTLRMAAPQWLADMIFEFMPTGTKTYRARLASIWCERNCILLPTPSMQNGDWYNALLDANTGQLWLFPHAAHDDMVDTISSGIMYLEHYIKEGWDLRQRMIA